MWISTVSSNLLRLACFSTEMARFSGAGPSLAILARKFSGWFLGHVPYLADVRCARMAKVRVLALDHDPHAAGGAGNDVRGVVLVAGIEVVQLSLGDLANLGGADGEPLVFAALLGFLFG